MGLLDAPALAAHMPAHDPRTRAHFLDFYYTLGLGAAGYISGQGAVATTLTTDLVVGNQTMVVASATGIVPEMTLIVYTPYNATTFQTPISYQAFVVESV